MTNEELLKKYNTLGVKQKDVKYNKFEDFRRDFIETVEIYGKLKRDGVILEDYTVKFEKRPILAKLMIESGISEKDVRAAIREVKSV